MTTNTNPPQPDMVAFEVAAAALWQAHRHYIAVLTERKVTEIPRSRRALYSTIKDYRRAETALHHLVTGEVERLDMESEAP